MPFVHLHTHTQYSMLDSTLRVGDLVARAVEDGAEAIAMTDHNNLFGAVEFYKAARKASIRPILGAEVNVVEGDRRDPELRSSATLVLLVASDVGYRNLCYLLSRGYMDAPARAPGPRVDHALVAEHSEGLIALSSSLSGEIPQALLRGDTDRARTLARRYAGLFKGRFYLEITRSGIKEEERVERGLCELGEELGLPLVAAADAHYGSSEDAGAHEVLMCIQMGKLLPGLETRARLTDGLHLAPEAEMAERFADLPEALENTERIAAACDFELELGETHLPSFEVPDGFDSEGYLAHLAHEGLSARLADARSMELEVDEPTYRERLGTELAIICGMKFPGYFLVVWDFIRWAKEHAIPVGPGRGSGAGSLVAYCLRITDIDPIRYGLLFERFLNPERVSMPDFDIDFCMHDRDRVIRYVADKYGRHNVGQIITYGTMKAKAVVRDVSRVLGLSYSEADRAAKLIPDELGMKLGKALELEPRLRELADEDPRYERLFEVALKLEGLNRQPGMHAAGVVIGDKPLWEYVPLYAVPDDEGEPILITQYAKNEVEEAGLVKFDFLGLKTLTVVDHTVRLVHDGQRARGEGLLDISRIPLDVSAVFELITDGDTTGVFQLESSGFKELLRKLKPDCFEDIIAAVALYRPGPLKSGMVSNYIERKHGRERVVFPHDSLAEVLDETYGVMVYQEQVMQAASLLAGYSLGQADILRRAMGKKKPEEMARQRQSFRDGCAAEGVGGDQADRIFDTIEHFAGYGFNKSHSAAYGLITYQTAWLKTHFPVEFMAALLTCDGDNTDKVVRLISEARSMGITVLPPSVARSALDFTVHEAAIRFGLGAIKGVGSGAVEVMLAAREAGEPFESLYDFCERVDLKRCNRRVLEALTKCGAFDDFGLPRKTIYEALDGAIERGQSVQRDREVGQFNLFGELEISAPPLPEEPEALAIGDEWSDKERLAGEKECLGFYVSGHPLDRYEVEIRRHGALPIAQLSETANFEEISLAGVVSALRERPLKSGNGRMAFVTLEDTTGSVEMLVFWSTYEGAEVALKSEEPLLVRAKVSHEGDADSRSIKVKPSEILTLAQVRGQRTDRVAIRVGVEAVVPERLSRLRELLFAPAEHVAPSPELDPEAPQLFPVELTLAFPDEGEAAVQLGAEYRMAAADEAVDRVEQVIGRGSVRFL